MVNELLTHGADVNAGSYPALTFEASESSALLVQVLLDKGAQITQSSWHNALSNNNTDVLRVLIEHTDTCKQVLPLHELFEHLAIEYRYREEKKPTLEKLQVILSRGYIPDTNSATAGHQFIQLLKDDSREAEEVVSMVLTQAPMMLQACRGSLQGVTLSHQFQMLLATPPSLRNQCKGVLISSIGHGYVKKVKELPLPPAMIKELETILH